MISIKHHRLPVATGAMRPCDHCGRRHNPRKGWFVFIPVVVGVRKLCRPCWRELR